MERLNEVVFNDVVRICNGGITLVSTEIKLSGGIDEWLGNDIVNIYKKLNGVDACEVYDEDSFYEAIAREYDCETDEIESLIFGDMDLSSEEMESFDYDELGGYINGVKY